MTRRMGGLIGSLLLMLMVLAACNQGTTSTEEIDVDVPDEAAEEVSADQIRTPEGDLEEFWNSFDWADLSAAEQEAWGVLGWDATSWDEETNIPASEEATWEELTPEEQAAVEQLGYTQETWDATAPEE